MLTAVLVRELIDGDSDSDDDPSAADGSSLRLVCGPELLAVCNQLAEDGELDVEVTIEDEASTTERLASGELSLTDGVAWLASAPWPAIAQAGGSDIPELAGSEVLAHSPAVIVGRSDRMAAVEGACNAVTWACIGESAGGQWTELGGEATWGRVEVGLPAPDTGSGTVAVNQAVASRVGTTGFATNDLDEPAVRSWFDRLAAQSAANESGTSPLTRFLRVPGALGVVGALEAEAVEQLSSAAAADELSTVVPDPVSMASVQLWADSPDDLARALGALGAQRLGAALVDRGWRESAPDEEGLPAPGVMSAVNSRWESAG